MLWSKALKCKKHCNSSSLCYSTLQFFIHIYGICYMLFPLPYSVCTINSITEAVLQSAWRWGHTFKLQLIDQLNLYDQCSAFFKAFAMLKNSLALLILNYKLWYFHLLCIYFLLRETVEDYICRHKVIWRTETKMMTFKRKLKNLKLIWRISKHPFSDENQKEIECPLAFTNLESPPAQRKKLRALSTCIKNSSPIQILTDNRGNLGE